MRLSSRRTLLDSILRFPSRVATTIAVLVVVAGTIAMITVAWTPPGISKSVIPPSLALQLKTKGDNLIFEWDRSAPEVTAATAGALVIVEADARVLRLPLTAAQLRAGTLTYSSSPVPQIREIRLEVREASGRTVNELIVLGALNERVSPIPASIPPQPSAPAIEPRVATARPKLVTKREPVTGDGVTAGRPVFDPGERPTAPGDTHPPAK